ncbi:hypothetical protein BD769DRAFT_1423189 [Suillus cothurnatus]|nr:hypothetical protein BD769DRAFT_1423189 [Suillus cothurnatus]
MDAVLCTEKHNTSSSQRKTGTGRWIFHANEYETWNKSDHAFLWMNSLPGYGKTIFASSIIDEILGSSEAEPQTLAYFHCNFGDDRTTDAAAVLRSLVVQFLLGSEVDWFTKIREPEVQGEEELVSLRKF